MAFELSNMWSFTQYIYIFGKLILTQSVRCVCDISRETKITEKDDSNEQYITHWASRVTPLPPLTHAGLWLWALSKGKI